MHNDNQLAVVASPERELTVADVRAQVALVQSVLRDVMLPGHHYGQVPGTQGVVLLKPGAEKLAMVFRLSPTYSIRKSELQNGHREYEVITTLTSIVTGVVVGNGVGCATTMEKKHRYRWQGNGRDRRRVENEDLADTYNTVLKMAKKRSLVDAILTATAASDIFAQQEEGEEPDEAPQNTKPTAKQEAIRACQGLATDIGLERADMTELLKTNGITLPTKWGDLDEVELNRVHEVLLKELKLRKGVTK